MLQSVNSSETLSDYRTAPRPLQGPTSNRLRSPVPRRRSPSPLRDDARARDRSGASSRLVHRETRLASHTTVPCKRGVDDDITVSPATSVSNELPEISRMGVDSAIVDLANIAQRLAELTDTRKTSLMCQLILPSFMP